MLARLSKYDLLLNDFELELSKKGLKLFTRAGKRIFRISNNQVCVHIGNESEFYPVEFGMNSSLTLLKQRLHHGLEQFLEKTAKRKAS